MAWYDTVQMKRQIKEILGGRCDSGEEVTSERLLEDFPRTRYLECKGRCVTVMEDERGAHVTCPRACGEDCLRAGYLNWKTGVVLNRETGPKIAAKGLGSRRQ